MNSYELIENRISEALQSIDSNLKPNFARLAREFAVPYRRLIERSKGRGSRSDRASVNLRLTPEEEQAICRYLDIIEEAGLYARHYHIERTANSILSRRIGEPELPVSIAWSTRFLMERSITWHAIKEEVN